MVLHIVAIDGSIQAVGIQRMTDTAPSERALRSVVDIHDRQYQKYSIDNSIYHIPVDEVRVGTVSSCLSLSLLFQTQRVAVFASLAAYRLIPLVLTDEC